MAGDHLDLFEILAHQLCTTGADIAVRSAVEAITANFILFVIFIGNGI